MKEFHVFYALPASQPSEKDQNIKREFKSSSTTEFAMASTKVTMFSSQVFLWMQDYAYRMNAFCIVLRWTQSKTRILTTQHWLYNTEQEDQVH